MKQLTLFFLFWLSVPSLYAAAPDQAPNFALKSAAGPNVRLSETRGQVVMLNFWATWCAPCRQELPLLENLYKRYRDTGLLILGVNAEDNPAGAQAMAASLKLSFPVLFDVKKDVSKQYGVSAMPYTVLIDRDGRIRHRHRGYVPGMEAQYEAQIRALLKE